MTADSAKTRQAAAMTRAERVLYHQVHPLKLATDISAAVASLVFLWQHELLAGLAIAFIPPIVVSAALLRSADLDAYQARAAGAYLRRFMTPLAQALRLVGFGVFAFGAWQRDPVVIVGGLLLVAACWSYGLVVLQLGPRS